MSFSIKEQCPCGGRVELNDTGGVYIKRGGEPDEHGDQYVYEKILRGWRENHAGHGAQ